MFRTGPADVTSVKVAGATASFVVQDDMTLRITMPRIKSALIAAKPVGAGGGVRQLAHSTVDITVATPWATTKAKDIYTYEL